jgi:hypothetical protein
MHIVKNYCKFNSLIWLKEDTKKHSVPYVKGISMEISVKITLYNPQVQLSHTH